MNSDLQPVCMLSFTVSMFVAQKAKMQPDVDVKDTQSSSFPSAEKFTVMGFSP